MIFIGGTEAGVFGIAALSALALYNYYPDFPLRIIIACLLLSAGCAYLGYRGFRRAGIC